MFPHLRARAVTEALVKELIPSLEVLAASLEKKSAEFKDVSSPDAPTDGCYPITLGQDFSGYAATVRYGIERVNASLPRVAEVPPRRHRSGHRVSIPRRAFRHV